MCARSLFTVPRPVFWCWIFMIQSSAKDRSFTDSASLECRYVKTFCFKTNDVQWNRNNNLKVSSVMEYFRTTTIRSRTMKKVEMKIQMVHPMTGASSGVCFVYILNNIHYHYTLYTIHYTLWPHLIWRI